MTNKGGNKGGRPSSYTKELGEEICERISLGESLIQITKDDHMPHHGTVFYWLRHLDEPEKQEFYNNYKRAREEQADYFYDEIKEIADDTSHDVGLDKDGKPYVIGDNIQRAKLRVSTRQWQMGRTAPKKYSEKKEIASTLTGALAQSRPLTEEETEMILKKLEETF